MALKERGPARSRQSVPAAPAAASTGYFHTADDVTPSAPKKCGCGFRLFASIAYFAMAFVCGYFALRNCSSFLPGSDRARLAVCTRTDNLINRLPLVNSIWDVLVQDLYPTGFPATVVVSFITKAVVFVLGPLSALLGFGALRGCLCKKSVLVHTYITFAVALLLAHAATHTHENANHVLNAIIGFLLVFPIATAITATSGGKDGAVGTAFRFVSVVFFLFLVASVYEFAVDHVPAAHGAPSIVDPVFEHPAVKGARPHIDALSHTVQQTTASATAALHSSFDTFAESAAELSDKALPIVQDATSKGANVVVKALKDALVLVQDKIASFRK